MAKSNQRYEHILVNNHNNVNDLQFQLDIDGEDKYVDEELLSINDDYLSLSSPSSAFTANTNISFEMKKHIRKLKITFLL